MSYGDVRGVANVGAIQGGFGWRVSRTPHRTDLFLDLRVPPTSRWRRRGGARSSSRAGSRASRPRCT